MKTNQLLSEGLEIISSRKREEKFQPLKVFSWLKQAGRFVIDVLTKEPQIKIEEKCDRQGNTYWYVYDPATDYASYFTTEQEVLTWIEERYQHRNTAHRTYLETQSWELWLRQKM